MDLFKKAVQAPLPPVGPQFLDSGGFRNAALPQLTPEHAKGALKAMGLAGLVGAGALAAPLIPAAAGTGALSTAAPWMIRGGLSLASGRMGENLNRIRSGTPKGIASGILGTVADMAPGMALNTAAGIGEGVVTNNLGDAISPLAGLVGGRFGKRLAGSIGQTVGDIAGTAATQIPLQNKQIVPTAQPIQPIQPIAPSTPAYRQGPIEYSLNTAADLQKKSAIKKAVILKIAKILEGR